MRSYARVAPGRSDRFGHAAALLAALTLVLPAGAAELFPHKDRQPTPEELAHLPGVDPESASALLKDVQVPNDFEFSIFATPPAVNYPVFVAAATDGTLYVSSDGNGSIDRKPHMGRILRVRDTDHDGKADEVKAFVPDVDSPRGLVWDHDRLYLLHPPDISVFIDRDGDGVADEKQTLVKGIGWTFKDRPADHASNGLTLGIDGWLYAAIGDFGFMEAVGTDGKKLQLRGGGVVRLRPDGSGIELWADGTRNILEVAMSPLLDGFARDNTNDGGGWDIRLHHFSGMTQHGYPRLFKNFSDEIIPPLADYGGGSGCGAAFVDEPGIPERWNNAPFTADWGRDWIYHHGLKSSGGTFAASQEEFLRLPRVTDLDVDGNSAIYAASWKGASFTWVGPSVGFLVKVQPKGFHADPLPAFDTLDQKSLLSYLGSNSHRRRLEAQRTLLRRGTAEALGAPLRAMIQDRGLTTASRVAATFLLKLKLGSAADEFLSAQISDPTLAPWALRALSDGSQPSSSISSSVLELAARSQDPRLRKEVCLAVAHGGAAPTASLVAGMLGDSDSIVRHTAVESLLRLKAVAPCLAVLDDTSASPSQRAGALQVLQSIHRADVVEALLSRLQHESELSRRGPLITALCRLYFQEGPWKGDSWGTRPDTRGPFYQPEPWSETPRISEALTSAIHKAEAAEVALIGRELSRHRIPAGAALESMITRAGSDPSLLPAIAAQLAQAEEVPSAAVPLLVTLAEAPSTSDAARAQAVMALVKTDRPEAWVAVLHALPRVQRTSSENNLAEKAAGAFRNAPKLDLVHEVFEQQAALIQGDSSLLAETSLLRLASRKVGSPEARQSAIQAIDHGWELPKRRLQILRAAAQAGDARLAGKFVSALNDPDAEVVKAARETVKRLKIDPDKFRAEAGATKIADLKLDDVLAQVVGVKGEVSRGEQLFGSVGCNGCHTVKADEPLKGPFLGTIANVYRRRDLAEAILVPSKTIAQGFVANHFELKDGSEVDAFVVREAADAVTVRTIAAQEQTIPVKQIATREKREKSLMPEGLAAGLTVKELASLLDYLESLSHSSNKTP